MNTCQRFATIMAKRHGMTYKEACEKYPRGYELGSVYKNDCEIHKGHCTHCARAEVIGGMK